MDLRSIINSDVSSAAQPRRAQPLQPSPTKQNAIEPHPGHQGSYVSSSSSSSNNNGHQQRPAPPPPLQPPGPNDFQSPGGSSSYHSAQSPYQQTPSSSLSGGQYPFPQHPPQSPAQGSRHQGYQHRDSHPSVTPTGYIPQQPYGYPSHSPYTPAATTPGGSHYYPQQHPSQSSHSSPTPTSAQSQGGYAHRESPLSTGSHSVTHQHRLPLSQPGTPLGPPIERQRASAGVYREEPIPYTKYQSNESPITPSYSPISTIPPSQMNTKPSRALQNSPTKYKHSQPTLTESEANIRDYHTERDRERSLSVSPKTKVPSQSRQETAETRYGGQEAWSGQVTPAKRKADDNLQCEKYNHYEHKRTSPRNVITAQPETPDRSRVPEILANNRSVTDGVGGVAHHQGDTNYPSNEDKAIQNRTSFGEQHHTIALSPLPYNNSASQLAMNSQNHPNPKSGSAPLPLSPTKRPSLTPQPPSDRPSPIPQIPTNRATPQPATPTSRLPSMTESGRQDQKVKRTLETALGSSDTSQQPPNKKIRRREVPVWAQCVHPGRWNSYKPQSSGPTKQEPVRKEAIKRKSQDMEGTRSAILKEEAQTHTPPGAINGVGLPSAAPDYGDYGPIGPWEPSIINTIPYEEFSREIAAFLMTQVVERDDIAAGGAEVVSAQEAVLEIEAKIGQLIDSNTEQRLALPVRSECIIDSERSNIRTHFRSSMTEAQHRSLNQFLNEATRASKLLDAPPHGEQPKARIPMTYKHRRERDTFHELPQTAHSFLPRLIREHPSIQRHGVRVRVSYDQATGKELAKIIKLRIADLEIYSPLTAFDWRVSVSLEMKYEGPLGAATTDPDRNKDRMSYHHLAYDIDLTQVTTIPNTGSRPTKEHELEVEIDAAKVRRQGLLAKSNQPHQYEDLVRGFVDNVRLLARMGSRVRG